MLNNYTHIVLVTDRSGSMDQIREDAQGGINTFIREQRELEGVATFSLYDFDDKYRKVFGPEDIKKFQDYKLEPRGSTAMLDAIGRSIKETELFINAIPEAARPKNVVFVIVTDGFENASREYNYDSIKKLVNAKQEEDWKFVFLAGDQDAVLGGAKMGINFTTSYVNNGASASAVYGSVSSTVTGLRNAGTFNVAKAVDSEGNIVN